MLLPTVRASSEIRSKKVMVKEVMVPVDIAAIPGKPQVPRQDSLGLDNGSNTVNLHARTDCRKSGKDSLKGCSESRSGSNYHS
jgi:hypothetical protein